MRPGCPGEPAWPGTPSSTPVGSRELLVNPQEPEVRGGGPMQPVPGGVCGGREPKERLVGIPATMRGAGQSEH